MDKKITLRHGSGGKFTHELIIRIFKKYFNNKFLNSLDDSAVLTIPHPNTRFCFTTDSYVVKPIFFPGGDIGKLSICGTLNDLSVMGAVPLYISCGFIIEEGLPVCDLEKVAKSMNTAARKAGVRIVTGDTKVVEKNSCDKVYINTSGIGFLKGSLNLSLDSIKTGDKIIINGTIAEHGLAVLSARENFEFRNKISSDCASLDKLISGILSTGARIKFMRDPTRGGIAATLNEIAENRNFGIMLEEKNIPIKNDVKALCELLGFDPVYIANEGKVIIVVDSRDTDKVLNKMYNDASGKNACIIGEIVSKPSGTVIIKTSAGGSRIIDMPAGDQLPRIC